MKITKYGHSCLLIEIGEARIITDPGKWNPVPDADGIGAVLVTHEHQDHCDTEQLNSILSKNPRARIITHAAVGAKLDEAGISREIIESGADIDVADVRIESWGTEHAAIYGGVSPCRNTGFKIGGDLFFPGDALHDMPPSPVRVLALPCGGPWMRLSEAIDYAKAVKPEVVFPIHDAMYTEEYRGELIPRIVGGNLESAGIRFVDLPAGATRDF